MDAKPNDEPADATEEPAEGTPTEEPAANDEDGADDEFVHLDNLDDGVGCAEIWEHLSETRGDE